MSQQPDLRKYRVEMSTTKIEPGTHSHISTVVYLFARDLDHAQKKAKRVGFKAEDTPVRYAFSEFSHWYVCKKMPLRNRTWWENSALQAMEMSSEHEAGSLLDLAQNIRDGYRELAGRDGEPGPRPGKINIIKGEGRLVIKSTRILAIVTLVEWKGGDRD